MEQNRAQAVLSNHHELARTALDQISHQVIVDLIAATTTITGLTVQCVLDTNEYPIGVKYTNADVDALPLTRHDFHGEWNYTLTPPDTP